MDVLVARQNAQHNMGCGASVHMCPSLQAYWMGTLFIITACTLVHAVMDTNPITRIMFGITPAPKQTQLNPAAKDK